jgi:segregation and condensation protein A
LSTKRHLPCGDEATARRETSWTVRMPHEVKLDVFSGPIDLLLHLITRRRVDIYEVSLSEITDEYVAWLSNVAELDLESATGFVVIAATLMELKSARLLPQGPADDSASLLEERDLLLARLVECATFREAGSWIRGRMSAGDLCHPRDAGLEPQFVAAAPDLLAHARVEDLADIASRLFAPKPQPQLDTSHVAPIRASVRDAIELIGARLADGRRWSFRRLCEGARERIEVVVRFLALLELFKAGAIELDQSERWGDIVVARTGDVSVAEVVEEAEEYASIGRAYDAST